MTTPIGKKRGKLSLEEMAIIKDGAGNLPVEEIAESINRNIEPVIRYMQENGLMEKYQTEQEVLHAQIRTKLLEEKFWGYTKQNLLPHEVEFFINAWTRYIEQFYNDVLPTEELQIKDLVMLDILQNRLMTSFKINGEEIVRMQKLLDLELEKRPDDPERDKDAIKRYTELIRAAQESVQAYNKDNIKFLEEKARLLTGLNATRTARVKNLENLKVDWGSLMRRFETEEAREREGIEMELRKKAAFKARHDMGKFHTYLDGKVDKPLFNSDTVEDD